MWTIFRSHNSYYIILLFICQVKLVEDLGIEPSRQVPCKGSPLTPEHPPNLVRQVGFEPTYEPRI